MTQDQTHDILYMLVEWEHAHDDYPQFLYAELGRDMLEVRKVETFPDGRSFKVELECPSDGPTRLSEHTWPEVEEINASEGEKFSARLLSRSEFEAVWLSASD
ncbi:hypothetical protein [Deinococcus sp.]|uniref:DUF6881 domain-containing protein n=1 Tax=Deinococcus sp. TaxID=47478 RepID=UPI0025EFE20B|nr:hypothetical protein [Deinococcus sp.]